MQLHRPVPRRLEQRRRQPLRVVELIDWDPTRLIGVPEDRHLLAVIIPPEAARSLVSPDRVGCESPDDVRVPHELGGDVVEPEPDPEALGALLHPCAKGPPEPLAAVCAHPLKRKRDVQRVVSPHGDLLTPVLVAELLSIELEEALEQRHERSLALGPDVTIDPTEMRR